jgi:dTDP-4-amino-4,6-dideoxygalactose transaminase
MNSWPVFDDEQIADVVAVLRSGRVNAWTGNHVAEFEASYASHLGRRHAIALANGTVALDLAMQALGVSEGDEVIVTPRSFIASAACVALAGGTPVFADVDADSQNLSAETIAAALTPRTKGIVLVHLAGWPCDMDPIMELARSRGLWVVEDCAQAHGALYKGRPVGSFGDIAAFSFCQDKIITTGGEGGLLAMDDDAMWNVAWSMKDHGKSFDAVFNRKHSPGFRWLHESIGSNYRMMSIQAVLGSRQLERLGEWHAHRAANAEILIEALGNLSGLRVPQPAEHSRHAWYRFYAFVRPERLKQGWSRDRILAEITKKDVPAFSGSCPEIYLEKAFTARGFGPPSRLPVAREIGETSMAFLVDPARSANVTREAGKVIRTVVEEATLH